MKTKLLKFKTRSYLRNNKSMRVSLPYQQAVTIGLLFTVDDRQKHEEVKELIKKLEHEGKQVTTLAFLPKEKENHEFMFDFFTEKEVSFWGEVQSKNASRFCDTSFDFVFYLDTQPNPFLLNLLARCKSKCRVGKYWEKSEAFFELMIQSQHPSSLFLREIHRYASSLK